MEKTRLPGFLTEASIESPSKTYLGSKLEIGDYFYNILPAAFPRINFSCTTGGRPCPIVCIGLSNGDVVCYCDCTNAIANSMSTKIA